VDAEIAARLGMLGDEDEWETTDVPDGKQTDTKESPTEE
jgi:hypothetical protein